MSKYTFSTASILGILLAFACSVLMMSGSIFAGYYFTGLAWLIVALLIGWIVHIKADEEKQR